MRLETRRNPFGSHFPLPAEEELDRGFHCRNGMNFLEPTLGNAGLRLLRSVKPRISLKIEKGTARALPKTYRHSFREGSRIRPPTQRRNQRVGRPAYLRSSESRRPDDSITGWKNHSAGQPHSLDLPLRLAFSLATPSSALAEFLGLRERVEGGNGFDEAGDGQGIANTAR